MWLLTTALTALLFTLLWYRGPKQYRFDIPAFMLWGATVMILVDHIIGYEGGAFLELETDGLITNSLLLGALMVVPVFLFWGVYLLYKKPTVTMQQR